MTPLTNYILRIRPIIETMKHQLLAEGKRVAIILATDGLPSDQTGRSSIHERENFVQSLRQIESFPVWVVVRLCTDDDSILVNNDYFYFKWNLSKITRSMNFTLTFSLHKTSYFSDMCMNRNFTII